MEYIKGRLDEAINGLEGYKKQYPKTQTQDVIDMLKRLVDLLDDEQCNIPVVGWRSEQLPDFDVEEINEIVTDCKEKQEDLQALICRIWNKGYTTAVVDEREG